AEVVAFDDVDESDVLTTAAAVESHSEHPIAQVVVEAAENVSLPPAESFEALPGLGAKGVVEGKPVWVGNRRLVEQSGAAWNDAVARAVQRLADQGCSVVYVVREDRVIGLIAVADTLRPEAPTAVARLRRYGVERIVMLTGDTRAAAAMVASRLGIDDVRAELLPADKVEAIRDIRRNHQPVAMVGDGINDAPSLAAADVGIAPAEMGADITIEAADLILVGDDLRKLAEAVRRSRLMLKVIWQNIIAFALLFNIAAVLAAAMGWISPVAGAIIHQVSSLTVVLNSLRLLVDGHEMRHRWKHFREGVRKRRPLWIGGAVVLALVLYAASGVYVVGPNEQAIVRVFGRYVGEPVGPGLHVTWPYPMGKVDRVRTALVRRVPIGFRVQGGLAAEPPSYEWNVQHRGGRYTRVPEEAELWAGDQNLVDINVVVQYRVVDPAAALFSAGGNDDSRRGLAARLRDAWSALPALLRSSPAEPTPAELVPTAEPPAATTDASASLPPVLPDAAKENRWDRLVRAACEACLRAEMARRESDAVLASNRSELERVIAAATQAKLDAWKTGLQIESVCLGDIHPPLEVVSAFRDVAAAMEEKEAVISEALAYQVEKDRQSRAEAVASKARGEAAKSQAITVAEGEAARLEALSEAYRLEPQAAQFRHRIETQEAILAGRRKWILDPGAGSRRVWLWSKATGLLPPNIVEPEPAPEAYNP
ncbi:MAG: cation-translocating P-type ATPase family protein, partial [Planctomycetota bacterium]